MEDKNLMEGVNETVNGKGFASNGSLIAKLAVAAVGVATGIGAVLFYKKKKNQRELDECVEPSTEENDNINE